MHDFDIWLSNSGPPFPSTINNQYKLCKHRSGTVGSGVTETIFCDSPVEGRFIYISINTTSPEVLTVCELEVYGTSK